MAEKIVKKRGWFLMRSWDYDKNDPTSKYHGLDEVEWQEGVLEEWTALAQAKNIDWCQFIFHDADEVLDDATGKKTIKPIHAHAVVRFKNARVQSGVMKDFCGSNQRSENCQYVDPQKGGFRQVLLYLTHHTTSAYNDEKSWYHHGYVHQYGKRYLDLIKTDKRERSNLRDVQDTADALIERIVGGDMTLTQAKLEFLEEEGAAALVKHRSSFDAAFEEFRGFKVKELQKKSDAGLYNKVTSYISGSSQTGKSAIASSLAVDAVGEDDVFTVASGGSDKITNDFVDGYEAEAATIFNDYDAIDFGQRAFFNMFDPGKWSISKSRNVNKPWLSTHCYIATASPIGESMIRMLTNGYRDSIPNEFQAVFDLRQAYRRVQRLMSYGKDASGNPVLWVAKMKAKLPSEDEIMDYAKTHFNNMLDARLVELFYDTLGHVPYDESITETKPFHDERMRMAKIINEVYSGNLGANGFVRI